MAENEDCNGSSTPSMKCEIKVWHSRYDKDGQQEKVQIEDGIKDDKPVEDTSALVLTKTFNEKHRLESTTLNVNSPHILKALQDVVKHHPSIATDFLDPVEMTDSFQVFYHHWEELDQYREALEPADAEPRKHVDLLFDLLRSEFASTKDLLDRQVKSGKCDFAHLWYIFKPGTLALTYHKSYPWLLKIVRTAYDEDDCDGKYFEVQCAHTDHNGVQLGEVKKVFKIVQRKDFGSDGPAKIRDLQVFPRSHLEDGEEFEEGLRKRGDEFVAISEKVSVSSYEGLAEHIKDPPPDFFDIRETDDWIVWRSYTESGRIVLDRSTYEEKTFQTELVSKQQFSSLDKALCPPFVFGYSCGRKEWCRFFLPFIQEAKWKPDPFSGLSLPEDKKTLVRALVSSHQFPESARDRVEQKGKGLVCLLHGPPGSGKSLTAECAAELTHRALFNCSMSELNQYNSAWYFESQLSEILTLASIWNAVVLLDEADVFLEARRDDSPDSTERNALVAVFLKHLEYFGGIVFLTTNRIHVFDAAMKSRVHIALGYDAPDDESRRFIWSHNFSKIPEEQIEIDLEEELGDLAAEKMNGREIANAVITASTLARFSSEKLQLHHVEAVLNIRREFEKSLKSVKDDLVSPTPSLKQHPKGWELLRRGSVLDEV